MPTHPLSQVSDPEPPKTKQVISNLGRAIRADPKVGLSVSSASKSPRLTGNFGPANVVFTSITAAPPTGVGDTYRSGSKITCVFSRDTNQGFQTLGGTTTLTKTQVDALLTSSVPLGATYTGDWTTLSTLVITVTDVTGAGPPTVGEFFMTVKSGGELRNVPPASAPSTARSGVLAGNFGASTIAITSLVASDPANIDVSFSVNDTITVTFNQDTNMGGLPLATRLTKAQARALPRSPQPFLPHATLVYCRSHVLGVVL